MSFISTTLFLAFVAANVVGVLAFNVFMSEKLSSHARSLHE